MNKVILIGNLSRDPELTTTNGEFLFADLQSLFKEDFKMPKAKEMPTSSTLLFGVLRLKTAINI